MTSFPKIWNLSPKFAIGLVFLYANSVFVHFSLDTSTANNEVHLYVHFIREFKKLVLLKINV